MTRNDNERNAPSVTVTGNPEQSGGEPRLHPER